MSQLASNGPTNTIMRKLFSKFLTRLKPIITSYTNQPIEFSCKSVGWFLSDQNIDLT